MAVPYEKLVIEDLNRGWGPVTVTMPGGGTATGSKVGVHALLGEHYNVQDFGAVGDGVTDDTAAIQLAITTCAAGGLVWFPRVASYYRITDALAISKALTIDGGGAQIRQLTAGKNGFTVTASNVTIRNVALYGKQFAANNSNLEAGIACVGVSAASPYTNLTIDHVAIRNFGDYGVNLQWVTDFRVEHCDVQDIFYIGIGGTSVLRGHISHNRIKNIIGTTVTNAYGITLSRMATSSLVTDPRCADVVIDGNVIQDITGWEGIDTHAGQRITISNNVVSNTRYGIVATASNNGSAISTYAPLDITITGNVLDSGVTDGSRYDGIQLIGAGPSAGSYVQKATGIIANNVVRGYGLSTGTPGAGGILVRTTQGLIITGNLLYECSPHGINLWYSNYNFVCSGNTIIDPFADTATVGQAVGIYLRDGANGGFIGGNTITRGDRSFGGGITTLTYGIRTSSSAPVLGLLFGLNQIANVSTNAIFDAQTGVTSFDGTLILPSYLDVAQITLPVAPMPTRVRLYARDTGFTRAEVVARFPTGVIQRLVREPRALAAGNIALSAGWGDTATLQSIDGTDFYGRLQVRANGAGLAAFCTVTITFNNSTFEQPPYGIAQRNDGNAPLTAYVYWTATITTFVMTFTGLPVAGSNYNLAWLIGQ